MRVTTTRRCRSFVRNLALVTGSADVDMAGVLEALRLQQGMLYYHLLLARLQTRGVLGGG